MPNWKDILDELREQGSTHDIIRRKYLLKLHESTGRNVIAYYSGFLQKKIRELQGELGINDNDKNGFMLLKRRKNKDPEISTGILNLALFESPPP